MITAAVPLATIYEDDQTGGGEGDIRCCVLVLAAPAREVYPMLKHVGESQGAERSLYSDLGLGVSAALSSQHRLDLSIAGADARSRP